VPNGLHVLLAKLAYLPSFVALAFQNGLEYRYAGEHINSGDWSTLYRNLVSFIGPVTPEFTRRECILSMRRMVKNWHIVPIISEYIGSMQKFRYNFLF